MANNVALLPENAGRVTAPSLAYPYGSAKDDSTGDTGDGMPVKIAYFNDSFGMQQALLRAAGLVPTGNADTALASQYMQAIVQLAAGRATQYDDTGAADAYVLAIRTNQQAPGGLFDGLAVEFSPANVNTGPSTVDVSAILGQTAGSTVLDAKTAQGAALSGGEMVGRVSLVYVAASNDLRVSAVSSSSFEALQTAVEGKVDAAGVETLATGSATFSNATNNINLAGFGASGVEVGDVVRVEGSPSNDKLFTVELITDADNVVVNYEHRNAAYIKSLVDEVAAVTVTLVSKWNIAPLGLGQGWCRPASGRTQGVDVTNTSGRTIGVSISTPASTSSATLTIDGVIVSNTDSTDADADTLSGVVSNLSDYSGFNIGGSPTWSELR